jgi:4,5-dihydroxyphthalate decarboxylase
MEEDTMTASTETLTLKTAIGPYGHFEAVKAGNAPSNLRFDHVDIAPIINAFRRMCRQLEFDVSEMAITTYLTARRYNLPFTAIPVFPVRAFHHGAISYNVNSGVKEPKDLEGKKLGMRAYTITTGVWARGVLTSEYGVDLSKIQFVHADEEHVEQFHKDAPPNITYQIGADLGKMHEEGELAGGIGLARGGPPAADAPPSNVKPLIPNAREAAAESFRKTGVYPINHMIVVKDEVVKQHPWVPEALFEAFAESKKAWQAKTPEAERNTLSGSTLQGDPYPYGIEANRKALEAVARFGREQKILTSELSVEDMFFPSTHKLQA